ncbi:MAG: GGDEF domain-containing protein, partial [Vallitaleaceae bacterium]|nr:GGDEF domain-containing protein [Vallitaleaceae bacterium]
AAAFIMFDLDYLKQINDSYGHQWGDIYIQKAVEALGKIDLNKGILGRRSGDEFILFLYGYVSKDEILGLMDRFYTKLKENPIQYPDGESKPITISGGLVWIHPPVEAYEEYMHRADALLYKAKFENKGSYEYEELDG